MKLNKTINYLILGAGLSGDGFLFRLFGYRTITDKPVELSRYAI